MLASGCQGVVSTEPPPGDAGTSDTGTSDAGTSDAGTGDAGTSDRCVVGRDPGAAYGAELFVSPAGNDVHPGSIEQPFATLERARDAVRDLRAATGLPTGGVVIWLRDGVHPRATTFELLAEDSGSAEKPVVFRAYPCERPRLIGAVPLQPEWFTTVTDKSPAWDRFDPTARGQVLQVDLGVHGITDHGRLEARGFGLTRSAALELFVDGQPMQLARWPEAHEHEPPASHEDRQITLFGASTPDVTGLYVATDTKDGVNAYARQGLVGGLQYNLYRHTWDYQGSTYTAWFLSTNTSGYPSDTDPWWHRYAQDLGDFTPGVGAAGSVSSHKPGRINRGFVSIATRLSDTAFSYSGTRPQRNVHEVDLSLVGWQGREGARPT